MCRCGLRGKFTYTKLLASALILSLRFNGHFPGEPELAGVH